MQHHRTNSLDRFNRKILLPSRRSCIEQHQVATTLAGPAQALCEVGDVGLDGQFAHFPGIELLRVRIQLRVVSRAFRFDGHGLHNADAGELAHGDTPLGGDEVSGVDIRLSSGPAATVGPTAAGRWRGRIDRQTVVSAG
jgi:hypothetical protein